MPGKKPKKSISEQHWRMILSAIHARKCVPFLGAAANISKPDGSYTGLPLGPEVARRLIGQIIGTDVKTTEELAKVTGISRKLKNADLAQDLARTWLENLPRVALHADVAGREDRKWLIQTVRDILDETHCQPSQLLNVLAELPLRLIVTTNFDDLLERAVDVAMRTALTISAADLADAQRLAAAIRQTPDAISDLLRARMTDGALALIDAWDGHSTPSGQLIDALVAELNGIANGPSIHDPQFFPQAAANPELAPLIGQPALSDAERLRLNRLLLELAFPLELRRARRKYQRIVQPMYGFDELKGKELAQNPPADDVLTIYKMHGSFSDPAAGVVITEDDYIHFLTVFNEEHRGIPGHVRANILDSTLLFLGYSLEDWDFRTLYKAMVEPIPKLQRSTSFAIQWDPPQFWVDYWDRKGVIIYNHDIHAFADELEKRYVKLYGSLSAAKAGV